MKAFVVKFRFFARREGEGPERGERAGSGILFTDEEKRQVLFLRGRLSSFAGGFFPVAGLLKNGSPMLERTSAGDYDMIEGPLTIVEELAFTDEEIHAVLDIPRQQKVISQTVALCLSRMPGPGR